MLARIWRGAVVQSDGDAYSRYLNETGVAGYSATPGNCGVLMLRRDVDDKTEFVMLSFWDSLEAIKSFAGENPEIAVFYPEDDRYLIERGDFVLHYAVVNSGDESADRRLTALTGSEG